VKIVRSVIRWLGIYGGDILFWGCITLGIANAVSVVTGPELMQSQFAALAVAFGAVAGLLYVGDPADPEE
jgi:hypothetical protein